MSLIANLGVLGYFKYGGFLLENFTVLANAAGVAYRPPDWDIVLPVGISFYTFQTISYTLDVYLRRAPPTKRSVPDDQPAVKTGEFLLGYANESGGTYQVTPAALSTNSSYAAFRLLQQDVAGFETFLQQYSAKAGIDVETLAAKVCGRWRNGNPLELFPDGPGTVLPSSQLNNFNYVNTADPSQDDTLGTKCPIGSHIRRNNPRNGLLSQILAHQIFQG